MATQLTTQHKVSRGDVFKIDTEDIIFDESKNTRSKEHTAESIKALAWKIYNTVGGQLQAGKGIKDVETGKPRLVIGHKRFRAVQHINDVINPSKGITDRWPYKIELFPAGTSEKELFLASIGENQDRTETSVIDDALNMRNAIQNYGMSEDEVAEIYGFADKNSVKQYLSLLALSDEERDAIHDSGLDFSSALRLARMSPELRQNTRARAAELAQEETDEKLNKLAKKFNTTPEVLAAEGKALLDDETIQAPVKGKKNVTRAKAAAKVLKASKKPKLSHVKRAAAEVANSRESLTMRDIKSFFKSVTLQDGRPTVIARASALQAFCEGRITEQECFDMVFDNKYTDKDIIDLCVGRKDKVAKTAKAKK